MCGDFGALLRADALAAFTPELADQLVHPRTEREPEADSSHHHAEGDVPQRRQGRVRRQEDAHPRDHKEDAGCEPSFRPAGQQVRARARQLRREAGDPRAARVGACPKDRRPEGDEADGPRRGVAEPKPGLARKDHHAGDDESDRHDLTYAGRASVGPVGRRVCVGHDQPGKQVHDDAEPAGEREDDERQANDDRVDPEPLGDPGGDAGHDPIAAASREQPVLEDRRNLHADDGLTALEQRQSGSSPRRAQHVSGFFQGDSRYHGARADRILRP